MMADVMGNRLLLAAPWPDRCTPLNTYCIGEATLGAEERSPQERSEGGEYPLGIPRWIEAGALLREICHKQASKPFCKGKGRQTILGTEVQKPIR